jgi:hypothetical protein
MSENSSRVIHLQWSGPFTWEEKDKLTGPEDYGVYQIYGCHPIYGSDVLIYVGQANKQTFSVRLNQERWWPAHHDFQRLSIYVGKCHGWEGTPSNEKWEEQIDLAEKLLILATKPAENARKGIDYNDPRLCGLHILNWGNYRSLPPEVSGRRHSSEFDVETNYRAFSTKSS